MTQGLLLLIAAAASLGFIHTLLGPDHYLPFIFMSRAGNWSRARTTLVTLLCGLGHVGSSVILGMAGIALGTAATKIEAVEAVRGDLAAWFLIAFGLIYFAWGMRRAWRNRPHAHWHIHGDSDDHSHSHVHSKRHLHAHEKEGTTRLTPWVLFVIFLFGPCEPLIPLLMYPAAKESLLGVAWVAAVFGSVTIATMLGVVTLATLGLKLLPLKRLERYSHALAGAAVLLCGVGIKFMGF